MPYPDTVLRRGEHVLAHRRPHWRMLVVPALVVPLTAFLASFAAALASGLTGTPAAVARVAILVVALALVGRFAVMPLLSWRWTHFVVTDRRLLVREGVVSRETVDVPGVSITEVRTRATARERLVGCGTLVVATTSAADPWEFAGLGGVDRLASLTEQMAEERGGLRDAPEDDDEDDDADEGPDGDDQPDEGKASARDDRHVRVRREPDDEVVARSRLRGRRGLAR